MKSTKKKAAKAAVDTNQVEHVIKTILSPRTQRISALEKILRKAEAANDRQTVGSLSAQLYQARAAKDREEAALTLASLGVTTSADSQAAAIAAASAPAIRRVQDGGPSMTGSSNPRGALQAVLSGQYTRESPPSTTILPSQRRILDLEAQQNIEQLRKQLDEAMASKDMQRASELSYRLTKTQLVDGHRRGVC